VVAVEFYLTDTAADGSRVNLREKGDRRIRSYRLVPPRSRARKVLEIDGDNEMMCLRVGFCGKAHY
jgi:hypothetical protein